jgi:hypothetical protein
LNLTNPNYRTYSDSTQTIPSAIPFIPFISNVQASNLSPTAELSWVQPTFALPLGMFRQTEIDVIDLSNDQFIDLFNIPGTSTSYNLASLAIPLSAGGNYAIAVDAVLDSRTWTH